MRIDGHIYDETLSPHYRLDYFMYPDPSDYILDERQHMTQLFRRVLPKIDNWYFWVGVAYFGLVATLIGLYVLYGRSGHEQSLRIADERATATAQVSNCISGVKSGPSIFEVIGAIELLTQNSITTTQQTLQITPMESPLFKIRKNSLNRLENAEKKVMHFKIFLVTHTPTISQCKKLAKQLHVILKGGGIR